MMKGVLGTATVIEPIESGGYLYVCTDDRIG